MTVEIAQLAVKCAEAQLEAARELLIDAIITEAGGDPRKVQLVSFGDFFRGAVAEVRECPRLVDPLAAFGAVERF
jgi:hypothetical protein